jgi:hypothetical protein
VESVFLFSYAILCRVVVFAGSRFPVEMRSKSIVQTITSRPAAILP